jgi:immune inhibitor A
MSFGSWNGSNGNSPSHPSAWCRKELGFINPVNVTSNRSSEPIQEVENGGSIYRLWSNGDSTSNEYFLVENRQRTGYDTGLPAQGLLIWHIDESKATNEAEWYPGLSGSNHYEVALEQADGLYQLELDVNSGNSGDPFPGSTLNTTFSAISLPSSDSYTGGATVVGVTNISSSASTMSADLIVGIAAGIDNEETTLPDNFELSQNYPNPFNPETVIRFNLPVGSEITLDVYNVMGQKVQSLVDGFVEAGEHQISWDATNSNGHLVGSGVYFYKLNTATGAQSKKMILVR